MRKIEDPLFYIRNADPKKLAKEAKLQAEIKAEWGHKTTDDHDYADQVTAVAKFASAGDKHAARLKLQRCLEIQSERIDTKYHLQGADGALFHIAEREGLVKYLRKDHPLRKKMEENKEILDRSFNLWGDRDR